MAAPQTPGFAGGNAGLLGVEQDPTNPNKYIATFANGNVVPLVGPTGKNLYDRQQAVRQLSAPAPTPAPTPQGEQAGASAQSPTKVVGGLPPDAPPPTQAHAAPQQTGPISLGQTLEATDPVTGKKFTGEAFKMPDGTVRVKREGTAGSPGGLTQLGEQTMRQYGEAQTLAAQHSERAAEHRQTAVDLAVQDAEARQAYIEEQKIQTQLEMQRQADEEAVLQKKVAGLEASHEKARQEFASARVDPDRYIKSKPGGNWIAGLSAALGAFGAAMARTPNFALDFINARIADDVRSQEAEINVKGRDADNQLAQLTRALGDLSLAKKSFRQMKLEEASMEGQRVANQFKGQEIANNARLVSEQSAAEGIRAGEERSRAFVEHVMKDKLYFRQGSAGTPGGYFLTGTSELQGRKNLETDPAATDKELARAQARAELHPVESGRTEKVAAFADGIDSALRIQSMLEERNVTGDVYDDPQGGPIDLLDMSKNADLRRDTLRLASGYQAARGKSDKDAELAEKDATGNGSGRDRYNSAKSAVKSFARKAKQELITLPPNKQAELLAGMSPEARDAITGAKTEEKE